MEEQKTTIDNKSMLQDFLNDYATFIDILELSNIRENVKKRQITCVMGYFSASAFLRMAGKLSKCIITSSPALEKAKFELWFSFYD